MRREALAVGLLAAGWAASAREATAQTPPGHPEIAPGAKCSVCHGASAPAPLHPEVSLLDAAGRNVLESALPVSPARTCAGCHDAAYIETHSYHACAGLPEMRPPGEVPGGRPWDTSPGPFGRWNPLAYRFLTPPGERPLDLGTPEWLRALGARHPGGGPAVRSRDLRPLASLPVSADSPETAVLEPASGEARSWDWRASGVAEFDCFLCHTPEPSVETRRAELREGRFGWASTATLAGTGLAKRTESGWTYERSAFTAKGAAPASALRIVPPSSRHCGACHGLVEESLGPDATPVEWKPGLEHWSTETKGQVFSPQQISFSAMNIEGRSELHRPWDVHAERLLECSNCHHPVNHPVFRHEADLTKPAHLRFDGRALDIAEYLRRPSHDFARGESAQGPFAPLLRGTMRRCEDCHDYDASHRWLPHREHHARVLLCESCHVPRTYASARSATDWTVLGPDRGPVVHYRGVRGPAGDPASVVTGFEPILLPRKAKDGSSKLAPLNIIASWFWVGGDPPRPVRKRDLEAALFDGASYHPAVLAALDADRSGALEAAELRLDSPAKVEAVRARLEAVGVANPRIQGEIQPFSLHHGVAAGAWATRDCGSCHARGSRVARAFELAPYAPGGVLPEPVRDSNVAFEALRLLPLRDPAGALAGTLDTSEARLYLLGRDRTRWADGLGLAVFAATALAVLAHAGLRVALGRRRKEEAAQP